MRLPRRDQAGRKIPHVPFAVSTKGVVDRT